MARAEDGEYEYVAFADTEWIRNILMHDEPPKDQFFMTMPVTAEMDIDPRVMYATGVMEYHGKRFLAVVLPSPTPNQTARIVVLPGLGEQSAKAYRELLRMPEPTEPVKTLFNFKFSEPETRLPNPKGKWFLHHLWKSPMD